MSRSMLLLLLATSVILLCAGASAQDTHFKNGPQYLLPSYEVGTWGQPISTPTMELNGTNPTLEVGASNATNGNIAGAENSTLNMAPRATMVNYYSLYYGYAPVMSVSSASNVSNETEEMAPAMQGFRTGIGRIGTAQQLRYFGYGLPLGDAAREAKAHRQAAKRVYTNDDIQRLPVKQ